jgi:hypothetical protein
MAWKVESMENLKQKFILLFQTGKFTMVELCRQFGISRPTGYAILSRYQKEGWDALEELSRRPVHSPNRIGSDIENALLAERERHPRWGARKLLVLVRRSMPAAHLPSESTVNNILKRHGKVIPRKKGRRQLAGKFQYLDPQQPNEVWSADFKGKFRMGNDQYCYTPTTARRLGAPLLSGG